MPGEKTLTRRDATRRALILCAMFVAAATQTLPAQSGAFEQDSTLDNLVHTPGYRTAPPGSLGQVVRRGTGPIDVVIVPGWGFGAEVFDAFMRGNERRFRMVAVTLPGFAGTPAPAMPAPGTSYAAEPWTRAAAEAVGRLIVSEGLQRPVVLGHFIIGTQVALRLAADRPELVGGVVIVGGEPMRFSPSRRDSTGRTPMDAEERAASVDRYLAPRWFKTVTRRTFDANNYAAPQYARDSTRARVLWNASAAVPLPVMIQYLCEYMAADYLDAIASLRVPTTVLVPGFAPDILSDPKQAYVRPLLVDSWEQVRSANRLLEIQAVPDSRIFITDDHPDVVRGAIEDAARASHRDGPRGGNRS